MKTKEELLEEIKSDANKLADKIAEFGDYYFDEVTGEQFHLLSNLNISLCNLIDND